MTDRPDERDHAEALLAALERLERFAADVTGGAHAAKVPTSIEAWRHAALEGTRLTAAVREAAEAVLEDREARRAAMRAAALALTTLDGDEVDEYLAS